MKIDEYLLMMVLYEQMNIIDIFVFVFERLLCHMLAVIVQVQAVVHVDIGVDND
jgi:hypothetical protein